MRMRFDPQPRLDCPPIEEVKLNLNCRDEIIPILRALQHIYSQPALRDQILDLIARDVNGETRDDAGREGMDYWQILVLAAVRLGCNLDYDRLQNLAEEHRALRHIMGIGDWDAFKAPKHPCGGIAPDNDIIARVIAGSYPGEVGHQAMSQNRCCHRLHIIW